MNAFILGLLFLITFPNEQVSAQKYAFVSVLSSNDFLIPAKVLGKLDYKLFYVTRKSK